MIAVLIVQFVIYFFGAVYTKEEVIALPFDAPRHME